MERIKATVGESVGPGEIVPKCQTGDSDCGPAAVYSVLTTFGIDFDYDELCLKLGTCDDGVGDVTKIICVFEEYGLETIEGDPSTMAELEAALTDGCFCLVEFQSPECDYDRDILRLLRSPELFESKDCGHYAVVFMISKIPDGRKLVWLMDPMIADGDESGLGAGVRVMDWDHFRARWEIQGEEPGWMLAVKRMC